MRFDSTTIKRGLFLTTFVAVTAIGPFTGWTQTIPKEGTIDATFNSAGSDIRELEAGHGETVYLFEANLLFANNVKMPLMQNITAHCVEARLSAGRGNGYCVFTDKDGDKFVETNSQPKGSTERKGTLGSGSGKYKGIEGQLDWQQILIRLAVVHAQITQRLAAQHHGPQ